MTDVEEGAGEGRADRRDRKEADGEKKSSEEETDGAEGAGEGGADREGGDGEEWRRDRQREKGCGRNDRRRRRSWEKGDLIARKGWVKRDGDEGIGRGIDEGERAREVRN